MGQAAQLNDEVGASRLTTLCITNGDVLHDLSNAWFWAVKPWMPEGSLKDILHHTRESADQL